MNRTFLLLIALVALNFTAAPAKAAQTIELVQVPCQFLDIESDKGFKSTSQADCEKINAESAEKRLQTAKVMELKAGDYVFRVSNKNVPYELGFWLRSKDYDWRNPLHKLTKTSVSGGGLTTGKSKDYEVSLKPGEYLYSCPLNTTPDYRLLVTE